MCGKVRDGDNRVVTVQDGDVNDKKVVIVDDLVQTGGTLYECGAKLLDLGAASVSAFVAHGVFPRGPGSASRAAATVMWRHEHRDNSIPTTTDKLPSDDVFEVVIDLTERVIDDADNARLPILVGGRRNRPSALSGPTPSRSAETCASARVNSRRAPSPYHPEFASP